VPNQSRHTSAEALKTFEGKAEELVTSGEFSVKIPASTVHTARPLRAEADVQMRIEEITERLQV
jgi:hypothetical protein